jgi:predicted MFS family arabinose efflux permease
MYATNGVSAFFVYSVGPATALIAADLDVTPQAASLHGTAMAAAMLINGAIASPIIARWGRLPSASAGMVLMSVGVLMVILAPALWVSLLGVFVAGTGGGLALIAANATLSVTHPDTAPTVLTEANAAAGWVGLLSPLLMGAFLAMGLGWRSGLALSIPMCLTLAMVLRGLARRSRSQASVAPEPVAAPGVESAADRPAAKSAAAGFTAPAEAAARPAGEAAAHPIAEPAARPAEPAARPAAGAASGAAGRPAVAGRRLPPMIWVVMVAVAATAGAEFGVGYWGAALLAGNTGAPAGAVTAAMSAPVAGVAVGRTLGAPLAMRLPAHAMLVSGWVVALLGFAVFWRASMLAVAVVGLFITGVGLSVTYPLLLDRAVLLLPDRPDRAMSLAAPFVGAAIGLAPFVLGALAGQVGLTMAFLVVPLLMIVGLAAVLGSRPAPQG